MNTLKKLSTVELLRCLRIDLEMLRSGEWVPDADSCEASLDVVDELIEREANE